MRSFIAVIPPPEVIEEVEHFLEPRRQAPAEHHRRWRWTRSEHLHLTLAFMPQVESWREEALIDSGMEWAQRQQPLTMALVGAGAFPDPAGARVLWAGVGPKDAGEMLGSWSASLRARANKEGMTVQGRRFTPHVTLARAAGARPTPAAHLLQSLDTLHTSSFTVREIELVASHLGQGARGAPRYETRHVWTLGH